MNRKAVSVKFIPIWLELSLISPMIQPLNIDSKPRLNSVKIFELEKPKMIQNKPDQLTEKSSFIPKFYFWSQCRKEGIRHRTTLDLNDTQSILSRSLFNFRVVVCRIRLFPTLTSEIKWSEPPIKDTTIPYGSTQMIFQMIFTRSNLILELIAQFHHPMVQQFHIKILPGIPFLDNIPTVRLWNPFLTT